MKIFIITLLSVLGSVIAECDYEKVMFLLCHSNFYNDENSNNQTQVAQSFFDNCEKGHGWDGTKEFVKSEESAFFAQVTDSLPGPPLSDVKTVKGYADWST